MYVNVHCGSVHDRQELETSQISTSQRTDNRTVMISCKGMLLSSKQKIQMSAHDMDKAQRYYVGERIQT